MSMNLNAEELKKMAKRMRLAGLEMALSSTNGSHLGGGFSCTEIIATLYGSVLNYDVKNPHNPNRDIFIPSKNHCVLAHLPALAEAGFFPKEELMEFQKDGGRLTGYPQNIDIGLEYSGGSLGMAISVGIGMAIYSKEAKKSNHFYILMGDGELNEGCIWEAFMSAAHFKLDNLTVIIDRNHLSYDGNTEEVMGLESLSDKMKAFNWHVVECNGHDTADLLRAFADKAKDKPNIIIADTVKGKGVSFMENRPEWHHSRITKDQYEQAKAEIERG